MEESFIHPVVHQEEDPHHTDCEELPDSFTDQIQTRKMACYMIILVAVLIFIVFIMNGVTVDYTFYAKDSGFPGHMTLITVTLLILATVSYLSFHLTASSHHPTLVFWMYAIIMLSYIFTIINLATRTEYYVKGVVLTGNGSTWLVVALIASLVILGIASQVGPGISLISLILTGLIMYLLYQWWFKTHTQFN